MRVELFFDYLSPYAYLAWRHLPRLIDVPVEPVPVLLAGLLNHHEILGPAEVPAKRAYLFRNVVRLAYDYGIPIAPPASHPFNPLLALRASCLPGGIEQRRSVIDRIFAAAWEHGVDISRPGALQDVIPELDLALAAADETKARLRAQTESAIARGVFGVPTFLVGEELFWGCDAMPHAAAYLQGEDPVADVDMSGWTHLRASAVRVPRAL